MDLRVKDLIVILMSVLIVLGVGYAYVCIENFIFDDMLSGYIPITGIWILRIIWTAIAVKKFCNISKDVTLKISQVDYSNLEVEGSNTEATVNDD